MASRSRDAAVNTLLNNLRVVAFSVYFLAGHFRPAAARKDLCEEGARGEGKAREGRREESFANAGDDERVSINRLSGASHRAIPVTRNSVRRSTRTH